MKTEEFAFSLAVKAVKAAKILLEQKKEIVATLFWEYFKSENPEKAEVVEKLLGYIPAKVYSEKIYNDDYGVWGAKLRFDDFEGEETYYVIDYSEYWDGNGEKVDNLDEPIADALMEVSYKYPFDARNIIAE
ncbi:MAG: hypothetical protein ACYCS0_01055 [bacterium]